MRILVLTLMMSFLSHSAFGSEGGATARVLASLEAVEVEGGGGAGAGGGADTKISIFNIHNICRKVDGFLDLEHMSNEKLYLISPELWHNLVDHHIRKSNKQREILKKQYAEQLYLCKYISANIRDQKIIERELETKIQRSLIEPEKGKLYQELAKETIKTKHLSTRHECEDKLLCEIQDQYFIEWLELQSLYQKICLLNEINILPHSYPYMHKLKEYITSWGLSIDLTHEVSVPDHLFVR